MHLNLAYLTFIDCTIIQFCNFQNVSSYDTTFQVLLSQVFCPLLLYNIEEWWKLSKLEEEATLDMQNNYAM